MKREALGKRRIAAIRIKTIAFFCSALMHVLALGLAAAVAEGHLVFDSVVNDVRPFSVTSELMGTARAAFPVSDVL